MNELFYYKEKQGRQQGVYRQKNYKMIAKW